MKINFQSTPCIGIQTEERHKENEKHELKKNDGKNKEK